MWVPNLCKNVKTLIFAGLGIDTPINYHWFGFASTRLQIVIIYTAWNAKWSIYICEVLPEHNIINKPLQRNSGVTGKRSDCEWANVGRTHINIRLNALVAPLAPDTNCSVCACVLKATHKFRQWSVNRTKFDSRQVSRWPVYFTHCVKLKWVLLPLDLKGDVVSCVCDQLLGVFVAQVAGVALSDFGDQVTGLEFTLGGSASQSLQQTRAKIRNACVM